MLRWYVWGNEKPGFVSVWKLAKDGSVKSLGEKRKDKLPKNAIYDCPWN